MIMKKIRLLLAIFLTILLIPSCDKVEPYEVKTELEIAASDLVQNFETKSTSRYINVKANKPFSAKSAAPDWCEVASFSGKENENLKISVKENSKPKQRTTKITVQAEGGNSDRNSCYTNRYRSSDLS